MIQNTRLFFSKISSDVKKTLFVISNKPLRDFDKIKVAVDSDDTKNGLPKGVCVICNQNFEVYAGSFAHHGLFIPAKNNSVFEEEMEIEDEVVEMGVVDKMEEDIEEK